MSRSLRPPIFGYTTVDPEREPDHIRKIFNPWDMHKDAKAGGLSCPMRICGNDPIRRR